MKHSITYILDNFRYLPQDFLDEFRFCLWRYESFGISSGLVTVPYGLDLKNHCITSLNLSNPNNLFGLDELFRIDSDLANNYGLGIVLNKSSYVFIDLNSCIKYSRHFSITSEAEEVIKKFPLAYYQIGPTGLDINILFHGSSSNIINQVFKLLNGGGTIEIKSGNSSDFMALTLECSLLYSLYKKDFSVSNRLKIGHYLTNSDSFFMLYHRWFKNIIVEHNNYLPLNNTVYNCDLLKVCNQMHIFHLGKQINIKNRIYTYGSGTENFVEFSVPEPLTASDLDYFILILKQFGSDKNLWLKYQRLPNKQFLTLSLDISAMLSDLGYKDSGKFRSNLISFLEKISSVVISYEKKISLNGFSIKGKGNLMTYFALTKPGYRKYKEIFVSINYFIYAILKESTYNYTIINTAYRYKLPTSQLRLIYDYLCYKTIPGANYYSKISIKDLLDHLWISSGNSSTMRTRKKRLLELLNLFSRYIDELKDLIFYQQYGTILIFLSDGIEIRVKRKVVKVVEFVTPF